MVHIMNIMIYIISVRGVQPSSVSAQQQCEWHQAARVSFRESPCMAVPTRTLFVPQQPGLMPVVDAVALYTSVYITHTWVVLPSSKSRQ